MLVVDIQLGMKEHKFHCDWKQSISTATTDYLLTQTYYGDDTGGTVKIRRKDTSHRRAKMV